MAHDELYAQRGVSAGKEDVHAAVKQLDKGLYPRAFAKLLPDLLAGDPGYALAMHVDTAGTKPAIAYLHWRETGELAVWRHIVQDALVMNLDDLACVGMTTGFVVSSNIARNKHLIPREVIEELIGGTAAYLEGLRVFGVVATLAGGETADVGDIVRTVDVGYTIAGRMPRADVLEVRPQVGDVVVGIASFGQATYESAYNSGIGSNGLTSARHDLLSAHYRDTYPETLAPETDPAVTYLGRYRLQDTVPNGASTHRIADLLLSPTRSYLPYLCRILPRFRQQVHGIVHNTGGGQTKVLHFLEAGLMVRKNNLPKPPIVFQLIQAAAPTPWREMYRTFNCGVRLELYTSPDTAAALIQAAQALGLEAWVIGEVAAHDGPATVQITHGEAVFRYTNEAQ